MPAAPKYQRELAKAPIAKAPEKGASGEELVKMCGGYKGQLVRTQRALNQCVVTQDKTARDLQTMRKQD